jgi:hypothetical protein
MQAQKRHRAPPGRPETQTSNNTGQDVASRVSTPAKGRQPALRFRNLRQHYSSIHQGEHDMASRPEIKVTKKAEPDDAVQEAPNQKVKKEAGNYRLQVDRQTKAFYMTEEAAQAAGLLIKKGHPVVQVSIYNSAEGINKIIELPGA